MRGSIVVLALVATPFVARTSLAQKQQGHEQHQQRWVYSHVVRHVRPARHDDDRDNKCKERQRGNPFQDHRADPRYRGNKDCPTDPPPAPQPPPVTQPPAPDSTPTPAPPPPPPAPAPAPAPDTTPAPPSGHTIVQGNVFFDLNQNGVFDTPDEVPLSGWTVAITGPMNLTAVTDGNGAYEFDGLVAGNYTVCVIPPAGWIQTAIIGAPSCGTNLYGYSLLGQQLDGDVVYSGVDFGFISQ